MISVLTTGNTRRKCFLTRCRYPSRRRWCNRSIGYYLSLCLTLLHSSVSFFSFLFYFTKRNNRSDYCRICNNDY
nr:MAG TPA_asm: hypothetical protein [Caudoviricetes sp.]